MQARDQILLLPPVQASSYITLRSIFFICDIFISHFIEFILHQQQYFTRILHGHPQNDSVVCRQPFEHKLSLKEGHVAWDEAVREVNARTDSSCSELVLGHYPCGFCPGVLW